MPEGTGRYELTRAGLLNLFEYAEQTFEFSGGHLLLRGHNGAGKSKALELLLPFVLDGDTTATKLDPFRSNARDMKWNLLMGERYENRVGYTWLEFARDEGPRRAYITAAVGLKATRDHASAQTWFVILRDARVGIDISLHNRVTDEPYPRKRLAHELGPAAEVFDNATDYRKRLNHLLFGFPEGTRYETMLELQRQLRRPQLSAGLEPDRLSEILSDSLPDISRDAVAPIGHSLDQIEQLRRDLAVATANREHLVSFIGVYENYAKGLLSERLGALRAAHAEERGARRALRDATRAKEEAVAALEAAGSKVADLVAEQQAAQGSYEELIGSPEYRASRRLRELRDAEADARRRLEQVERDLARAEEDLDDARTELARAAEEVDRTVAERDGVLARADSAATDAGITHHAELIEQLAEAEPQLLVAELSRRAAERRAAIGEQRKLRSEHQRLRDIAQDRGQQADEADVELSASREARELCEQTLEERRSELVEAAGDWASDPARVLVIHDDRHDALADAAALAGEHDGVLREALEPVVREARDEIAAQRERLDAESRDLDEAREELETERAALAERAEEIAPPGHPGRDYETRSEREGTPLWRAVDFQAALDDAARAGLEAALHGAGLLDAWLAPDGQLTAVEGDVLLTAGPPAPAGLAALTPDADAQLPEAAAAAVIGRMRFVERDADTANDGCVIGLDGSFRLGPAVGRVRPDGARYIGAAAREASRQRRIAELDEALAANAAARADLRRRGEALSQRQAAVDADIAALPSEAPTRAAWRELDRATGELARATERARTRRVQAEQAADAAQRALLACVSHAGEQRLPRPGQQPELDVLDDHVRAYRDLVVELGSARKQLGELLRRREVMGERVARLDAVASDHAGRREHASAELATRAGALQTAEQLDGATSQEVLAREEAIRTRLGEISDEIKIAQEHKEQAIAAQERTIAAYDNAVRVADERVQRTADAAAAMRVLDRHDFCALALGQDSPAPGELVAAADADALLGLLAGSEAQLAVTTRLETLERNVEAGVDELKTALDGSAGLEPFRERVDGVVNVGVHRSGGRSPIRVALADLDQEIATQQLALTSEEERAFEQFLLKGLADHLRERILSAGQLVAETNERIRACRTSSGVAVELLWQVDDTGEELLPRALALLRRNAEALNASEREQLIAFFRDRVDQARAAQDEGTVTDHLLRALDYRAWHRFTVMQIKDGQRVKLTAKAHKAGSGGEKSAALHLPLFAAMAALMESAAAHAPRIVMLDEAFAGIDATMRAQLLGLLQQLDLDFLLTSHELWCCEPELDALSIYLLHREEGVPGVATTQFLWDGTSRQEIAEAA